MDIITEVPEQTLQLGKYLGERCEPGDIFLLTGELGGGKTLLAKGIAGALGIPQNAVISPSFALIFEYRQGRFPLYHMDFYRLSRPEELEDLGLEMYFTGEGVVVIEWADRVPGGLPPGSLAVHFEWLGERRRRIELQPKTPKWKEIVDAVQR